MTTTTAAATTIQSKDIKETKVELYNKNADLQQQVDALSQQLEQAQRADAERQEAADRAAQLPAKKEPWFDIKGQKVLLPPSMDAINSYTNRPMVREFEYDGVQGITLNVSFMAGDRIGRSYDIEFMDNGFGNLRTQVIECINSGNLEMCFDARFNTREWISPTGNAVPFDTWKGIALYPVPAKKAAAKVDSKPESQEKKSEEVPF